MLVSTLALKDMTQITTMRKDVYSVASFELTTCIYYTNRSRYSCRWKDTKTYALKTTSLNKCLSV